MNLKQLFNTQATLDANINVKHPVKDGEDRLQNKILALQVELGECANEWRGFKFWSMDQEPRTTIRCVRCAGEGKRYDHTFTNKIECDWCNGTGSVGNPLLEEYVDCLHFILSIGLEQGFDKKTLNLCAVEGLKTQNVASQLTLLFRKLGDFSQIRNHNNYMYIFPLFVGLGEMFGFTWEQVEAAYFAKNEVNHQRQANGY